MVKVNTLYGLENISDCYYVSSEGDIINKITGKVKSQTIGKRGYYYVSLNEKKTSRQVKVTVHKIVALAFIRNAPYCDINHKDGNKLNNSIDNLEFCTRQENTIHAWKTGLIHRKERLFRVDFKEYSLVGTMKELSTKTGVPRGTLYDVFHKKKGGVSHGIIRVVEVTNNESQETIEMVSGA